MQRCATCAGWRPDGATCPNCALGGAPPAPWLGRLAGVAAGAAVSVTLAACYGAPMFDEARHAHDDYWRDKSAEGGGASPAGEAEDANRGASAATPPDAGGTSP